MNGNSIFIQGASLTKHYLFLTDQTSTYCSPAVKKKRALWTETDLENAVRDVQEGLTVSKASTLHGIPKSTLRLHMDNGIFSKRLGRKTIFTEDQERDFVSRILKFSELGLIPLTSKMIRIQAFAYCKKYNIPNNFNRKLEIAGKSWLKLFLERNQILKVTHGQKQHKPTQEVQKLYNAMDLIDDYD